MRNCPLPILTAESASLHLNVDWRRLRRLVTVDDTHTRTQYTGRTTHAINAQTSFSHRTKFQIVNFSPFPVPMFVRVTKDQLTPRVECLHSVASIHVEDWGGPTFATSQ